MEMETPPEANLVLPPEQPPCDPEPKRRYTLWELVRHKDDDRPEQPDSDPNSTVLSTIRPSAWPD